MTPVSFHFVLPTGQPIANSTVDIQLGRSSYNGHNTGITMPRPITINTDENGMAILNLWPSSTLYFMQVLDKESDAGIFYKFLVPEVPTGTVVRLQDLVIDGAMSGISYDDAALLAIHDAKANARASELAAAASAAEAKSFAGYIEGYLERALAARDAAVLSEFNAAVSAEHAAASEQAGASSAAQAASSASAASGYLSEVATNATAAAASATAAAGSANIATNQATDAAAAAAKATTKASEAAASATAASGSATTATTKAGEAAESAAAALASKNAAGTSETSAAASKNAAATSATGAAGSATTATNQATAAAGSAAAASTSATNAATSETNALASKNAAATSATAAAGSATSASGSATTATNQASAASASATAAAGSAGAAKTSEGNAKTSETNAGNSATAAAASAAAAAASVAAGVSSFNKRKGDVTLGIADVTSALGFTPYSAANPSGFISGINSGMVTTALGFTPYSATNPSGFISGINSGMVTSALGFTPYNASNPAGFITASASISGNAATASNLSNTGTVTLASATEANALTVTAPTYTIGSPVKLLNFSWYASAWSLGIIRGGATDNLGLGVYLDSVEKARFQNGSLLVGGSPVWTQASLTNLSQLTNGPGYITSAGSISGNAATATNAAQLGGIAAAGYAQTYNPTFSGSLNLFEGEGNGLNFWRSTAYSIAMGNSAEYRYGPVTDYSIKTSMDGAPGRGWVWGGRGAGPVAALSNTGNMQIAGLMTTAVGYSTSPVFSGRNPIWRFSTSDAYGLSYYQAWGWNGKDSIGIHFGQNAASGQSIQFTDRFQLVFPPNPSWGGRLILGGDGVNDILSRAGVASVATTNGNLHLDCGAGSTMHLNYYSGNGVVFGNGSNAIVASLDASGQLWKGTALGIGDRYATVGQAQRWTGTQSFMTNRGAATYLGSTNSAALMPSSSDLGPAFMSFHREGAYATNFGLDPDNVMRIGGWSAPANLWSLDTYYGNMGTLGSIRAGNGFYTNAASSLASLTINPSNISVGSYNEGLRIVSANNGYSLIALGADASGSGTIPGQWQIARAPSGILNFLNQVNTNCAYLTQAGDFTVSSSVSTGRVIAGYDSGVAGSVNANNWFRATGNSGLYFPDTGYGLYASQGDFGTIQTFGGGRAGWGGWSIAGGVVFMHNLSSTGTWGIFNDYNNTWMMSSDLVGNATFTGNVTAYSDRRIKKDIQPIKGALQDLLKIVGVTFKRIDNGQAGIGVIAQDVQLVYPQAVQETFKDAEKTDSVLTVAYGNLVGPIIEAIRELTTRVEKLEG